MGHVDHGKTTLLDYIRNSNVAGRESGGITQHIGAYQIEFKGKKLTFIDTPGHAAFNKMRERGAKTTDIVVLVVAADDGVKPQTLESIRHIQAANVSLVVAITKADLPNVYPDVAKSQLAEQGILVHGYGGSVDAIEVSAKTGKGVDTLLDTLVTMAELNNYQADPEAPLQAVVIESTKDPRRGAVATVIVQQGTLKVRQDIIADDVGGRVKLLSDENGQSLTEVLPGCPAEIIGFEDVPAVGSRVFDAANLPSEDEIAATDVVEPGVGSARADFDWFNTKPKLKLIIKADVQGTLEAILANLDSESTELLASGLGPVTDSELELANTSGAVILAFRVKVAKNLKEQAKNLGVKIKSYEVIYHLIEELQKQMLKLMEPGIDEVVTGEAEVIQIFEMRGERIAGCRVKTGELKKSDKYHLKRGEDTIADPQIKLMMHGKQEVDSAKAKSECGITFRQKNLQFQIGDKLIAYHLEDDEE